MRSSGLARLGRAIAYAAAYEVFRRDMATARSGPSGSWARQVGVGMYCLVCIDDRNAIGRRGNCRRCRSTGFVETAKAPVIARSLTVWGVDVTVGSAA